MASPLDGSAIRTRQLEPSHVSWRPLPYMERAVQHLVERYRAGLPLEPGGRKTSITLAAFLSLRSLLSEHLTALIIAPLRVCRQTWPDEIRKWTEFRGLKFEVLHGPNKLAALKRADADVYLINPEGLPWLGSQYGGRYTKAFNAEKYVAERPLPFDVVVIDELTKFKDSKSARSTILREHIRPGRGAPRWRWALTGSLAGDGNYEDVFGQQLMLDDGAALGMFFTNYRDKYFEPLPDGFNYALKDGCEEKILERLAPYWFYMDPADYAQLPSVIDDIRPIELTGEARRAYNDMKYQLLATLGGTTVEAANSGVAYNKLAQMANGAVYDGDREVHRIHDLKLDALEELIEELNGTPLLIGYEFNHDLDRLRARFGKDMPYLGKGTTAKQETEWLAAWNQGKLPFMAGHPASMGHGLNAQYSHAHHIAWFSIPWSFELYDQFIRRIRRSGNEAERIFNHLLIVSNSIDEDKLEARNTKGFTTTNLMRVLNRLILREQREAQGGGHAPETTEHETMVSRLSRPAAPQAAADPPAQPRGWGGGQPAVGAQPPHDQPAQTVQPRGWGAQQDGAADPAADQQQRERVREAIQPNAPQSQFSGATQEAAAQIQNGNYGAVGQQPQTDAPNPPAATQRAPRGSRKTTVAEPEVATPDQSAFAAVLGVRATIMDIALRNSPSDAALEDIAALADDIWAWVNKL